MTPKEQAEDLINSYRVILMNQDTECGEEILCSLIAMKCALVAVDKLELQALHWGHVDVAVYWQKVKKYFIDFELSK
jgi:hypothetical protein